LKNVQFRTLQATSIANAMPGENATPIELARSMPYLETEIEVVSRVAPKVLKAGFNKSILTSAAAD
jgi:hypothetical protein